MNELRILGIRVTAQTFEEAIGRILAAAESNDTAFRAHLHKMRSIFLILQNTSGSII